MTLAGVLRYALSSPFFRAAPPLKTPTSRRIGWKMPRRAARRSRCVVALDE
jgi:hypothetical protein